MTVTARRMNMGARTVTTGKQLLGQLHGPATHVGPNALLRSASYPAVTASPGTGPLRNPAIPTGGWFNLNGSSEFSPTADDAHDGMACDNWASGPTTAYAYNNSPSNHGGIVPAGGLKIDGFPVAAGATVYQFMDLSAGGPNLQNGVAAGGVVFRGCRFRGYMGPGSSGFVTVESDCTVPLYVMYCDFGGVGIDVTDQYSSDSLNSLATMSLVAYRNYFSLHGTAIQPNGWSPTSSGPCDVLENFMEKWVYNPAGEGDHDNGISASGNGWSCLRWQRNYILIEGTDPNGLVIDQTDCLSLGSDGGVSNVGTGTNPDGTPGFQITHNYCGGGGYPYYLGYNGSNTVSNLNFEGNLLTSSVWPVGSTTNGASGNGGGYNGSVDFAPPWGFDANTQSNNLWADGPDRGTSFVPVTAPILYGVTVDKITNMTGVMTSLNALITATGVKPTVRVYFDVTEPASYYASAVEEIHAVAYVMGELLDSSDEAGTVSAPYTTAAFSARVTDYLSTLGTNVDIWEIGNEVNGNWTETAGTWDGTYTIVVAKLTEAYNQVTAAGGQTALTLYANYSGVDGASELTPEAFTTAWMPSDVCNGLNYVLLSYYEEDQDNQRLTASQWASHFEALRALYPNAWQGFGEVGQDAPAGSGTHLTTGEGIADYYYALNPGLSYYVGGYFWWNWVEDCVPDTSPMFSHISSGFTNEAAALG